MWFIYLFNILIILTKGIFTLDIVEKIFYQQDELNKLKFTLDYRRNENNISTKSTQNNGEQIYGYKHKAIYNIVELSNKADIKDYFIDNTDNKSCEHYLSQRTNYTDEEIEKCGNRPVCGLKPKSSILDQKAENKNIFYCVYINKLAMHVYSVDSPILVEPEVLLNELFFVSDKKSSINCHNLKIRIHYINLHTHEGCNHDRVLDHIMKLCDNNHYCEFDFSKINESSQCFKNSFFVGILYLCKKDCHTSDETKTCDVYKNNVGASNRITCKYGYNHVENDKCRKNTACGDNVCKINQYCNESGNACVCKNGLTGSTESNCEYNNICDVLQCPEGSTCEKSNGNKNGECKCSGDKFFYRNKCYDKSELQLAIGLDLKKKTIIYKDQLYEGSALDHNHIYLKCEENYSIEVINAYGTCYQIQFKDNKIKYITDALKQKCEGRRMCAYGNSIDYKIDPNMNIECPNENVIYKYQYLCKANDQKENNNNNNKKVEIFRSRYDSNLHCEGGTISVAKAVIKAGEGCDDLDLTSSLKNYCDGLSNCDIGLLYKFDTYCINDQFLFVSYECKTLCTNNSCKENSSCYGNKHKYGCFCDKPYINKDDNGTCEKPTCGNVTCGNNQVCKEENSKVFCECDNGYKNVNGVCVEDNKCNLLCPSNKVCTIENGKQICKCPTGYSFINEKCSCEGEFVLENGKCVHADRCKREQYKNVCNKEGEVCVSTTGSDVVRCECGTHYEKDELGICRLKDYCKNHTCGRNEKCIISEFQPKCVCKDDFRREKEGVCIHENFCLNNKANCPSDSTCIYKEDSIHECRCHKKGQVVVDGKCILEDKCSSHNMCAENSICVNIAKQDPMCLCMFNYLKRDGICAIENPCLKNNGNCPNNSTCVFEENKIQCECKEHYKKENNICIPDIDPENDYDYVFDATKETSIILGTCGLIHFSPTSNQVTYKTNTKETMYLYNYEFPQTGELKASIKNKESYSIIFIKKLGVQDENYDDFQLDHESCIYRELFYHVDDEPNEKNK